MALPEEKDDDPLNDYEDDEDDDDETRHERREEEHDPELDDDSRVTMVRRVSMSSQVSLSVTSTSAQSTAAYSLGNTTMTTALPPQYFYSSYYHPYYYSDAIQDPATTSNSGYGVLMDCLLEQSLLVCHEMGQDVMGTARPIRW